MKITTIAATLLLTAAPAAAQTQDQLNADAMRDYRKADAALNAAYRGAVQRAKQADAGPGLKPTNPTHLGALVAAQRAWIVFRDAECRTVGYDYYGGTEAGMQEVYCKAGLTEDRTKELLPQPDGE